MRIVFLDVDGVLNWNGSWKKDWYGEKQEGFLRLDPQCCKIFQDIQKELNLTIVWSSTWRKDYFSVDYLKRRGLWINVHEDWRTPDSQPRNLDGRINYTYNGRGLEIDDWLKRHREEYENYVIIDDYDQFLPYQRKHFVQTSFHYGGFQEKHARKVQELFN